jgi:hypothetical protein
LVLVVLLVPAEAHLQLLLSHLQLVEVALVITREEMEPLADQVVVAVHLIVLAEQEHLDKVILVVPHKFMKVQAEEWVALVVAQVALEQPELLEMLETVELV